MEKGTIELKNISENIWVLSNIQEYKNKTLYIQQGEELYSCYLKQVRYNLCDKKTYFVFNTAQLGLIIKKEGDFKLYSSIENFYDNKPISFYGKTTSQDLATLINNIVGKNICYHTYSKSIQTYKWVKGDTKSFILNFPNYIIHDMDNTFHVEDIHQIELLNDTKIEDMYSSAVDCRKGNIHTIKVVEFNDDFNWNIVEQKYQLEELKKTYNQLGEKITSLEKSIALFDL